MTRHDPLRNFRFRVEIDGDTSAGFSDVELGAVVIEVVDYREGSDPASVRRLPGLKKSGNVVLKRGYIPESSVLFQWFAEVGQTPDYRKTVVIVMLGEDGSDRGRFVVRQAWPVKWHIAGLHAQGNDVLIETLELVNEGIERVS